MSAEMWRVFVRHVKSKVLKLFGEHISKLVDYERNNLVYSQSRQIIPKGGQEGKNGKRKADSD